MKKSFMFFRNKKVGIFLVSLCILLSLLFNLTVFAADFDRSDVAEKAPSGLTYQEKAEKKDTTDEVFPKRTTVNDIIKDITPDSCEYLYSIDGSSDYIYAELDGGGYAVFLSQTLELLEYSPRGTLPYPEDAQQKCYCGPGIYLIKQGTERFVDTRSMKEFCISKAVAIENSDSIRYAISKKEDHCINPAPFTVDAVKEMQSHLKESDSSPKGNSPSFSSPYITDLNVGSGTYINNYMYFVTDPQHGKNINNANVCGAVATQLLLGYHNYYSDRRIIQNQYLNGSNTTQEEKEKNPNYCTDPMSMTTYTLGTRGLNADGSDDPNSYFYKVIGKVPASASLSKLKKGIKNLLNENDISYSVDTHVGFLGLGAVNPSYVRDEIDQGRPVIVGMSRLLGGTNHWVVAYGYQDYTYPSTNETYSGYIVHCGWGSDEVNVWINKSWCDCCLTLNINHEHSYTVNMGAYGYNGDCEYLCSTCYHRTNKVINISTDPTSRFTERAMTLAPNTYQEYYVKWAAGGNMLLQTFGPGDTELYLYDSNMNLLAQDDNDGYLNNALISYELAANTTYILRVRFWSHYASGRIRLVIIPTYHHDHYESAYGPYNITSVSWTLYYDRVAMFRYKFTTAGDKTFSMTSNDNLDTFLFVIDPTSTAMTVRYTGTNKDADSLYDDDSGPGVSSRITKTVQANKEYVVFLAFNDPHNVTGPFTITTSNAP